MSIVDKVLKDFHGCVVNIVEQPQFTFGKELQLHVMEIRPNEPLASSAEFEETMQEAVQTLRAREEVKKYLPILQKRITKGNLSEIVRERVQVRGQKTDLREAILNVYSKLAESLIDNQLYF